MLREDIRKTPFTWFFSLNMMNRLLTKALEERMDIAQKVSSMILGLRRKVSIKVRQPLARIMVPVPDKYFRRKI
jgi:hypothetical protein